MPSPLIDTPEALDAAIATAVQTRREKLLHIAEGKGIRVRVAYACTAFVAICAVAALWAAGKRNADHGPIGTCVAGYRPVPVGRGELVAKRSAHRFGRFASTRRTLGKSAAKANAMTTAQKICAVPTMFPSRAIMQPAITAGSPIEM